MAARRTLGWTNLLGLGTVTAVLLGAGIALGWWLDSVWGTSPTMVVVGIALGLAGGVCYSVVQIRPFLKE
jgi:F0F1-type ATP synthase assembly protein I